MIINKIQNSSSLTDYITNHSSKILDDKRLSYGAKGVFSQLVYLYATNQFSLNALLHGGPESKDELKKYLHELIRYGYIKLYNSNNKKLFKIIC